MPTVPTLPEESVRLDPVLLKRSVLTVQLPEGVSFVLP